MNLWTGGDMRIAEIVGYVPFPVLNKWEYRGATVELAIDDMDRSEFEHEYGITAQEYRKVA